MKHSNGRIISVAPTDSNYFDEMKASFQFQWSRTLAAVIQYKYIRERRSMVWLRKLIFACVSKATHIRKVVQCLENGFIIFKGKIALVKSKRFSSKKRDTSSKRDTSYLFKPH